MFEPLEVATLRPAWSVAALIGAVAGMVQEAFDACTVQGEVSGFSRAASGHCYFNLKDAAGGASLRCALFRRAATLLDFAPRDGMAVELRGRLAVYEPRGELQFIVESMRRGGAGALYERFLRLRAALEREGLFEAAAKRALPAHPRRVGIVTSLAGAALHDVATTLGRRSPHVEAVVYPSVVQGGEAPAALCSAIVAAGRRNEVDVLIVCRGGGSLEDLWAFNEECVVRAIRAAPMPVVSGVGHETDVTLADLAADLRAATPTAAAELVAPATAACSQALDGLSLALRRRVLGALETQAERLDRAAVRLARPGDGLQRRSHALALLVQRLETVVQQTLVERRADLAAAATRARLGLALAGAQRRGRLDTVAGRLHGLDPRRVLERGYALLTDADGRAVVAAEGVAPGARVHAQLASGALTLTVDERADEGLSPPRLPAPPP